MHLCNRKDRTMSKIKIGVIGVGNMGKNHVRLLTEMKEDFDFQGVFDLNKEHVLKTQLKNLCQM